MTRQERNVLTCRGVEKDAICVENVPCCELKSTIIAYRCKGSLARVHALLRSVPYNLNNPLQPGKGQAASHFAPRPAWPSHARSPHPLVVTMTGPYRAFYLSVAATVGSHARVLIVCVPAKDLMATLAGLELFELSCSSLPPPEPEVASASQSQPACRGYCSLQMPSKRGCVRPRDYHMELLDFLPSHVWQ